MNQDEFKKLLEEALEPIIKKLNNHDERFDSIGEKLDNHGAALVNIESKLNAYGDMYKINNSNAGIQSPPELTLSEVQ